MTETDADPWADVAAFEHGRLRIYALDGDSDEGGRLVSALRAEPRDAGPVLAALGAKRIDPYWVDLVALRDISEIGLRGYLKQGYDVPDDQLAAADLKTTADHVLIVPSHAFDGEAQTLAPSPALRSLALIRLPQDVAALRPMTGHREGASAPDPGPKREAGPPAKRGLRPGAILILLAIAALFVLVVAL